MAETSLAQRVDCDCIRLIDEAFARDGMNTEVETALIYNTRSESKDVRISVPTRKVDSRARARKRILIAQFCPLCGNRYVAEAPTAASPPNAQEGGAP